MDKTVTTVSDRVNTVHVCTMCTVEYTVWSKLNILPYMYHAHNYSNRHTLDHSHSVRQAGNTFQRRSVAQFILITTLGKGLHSTQDRTEPSTATH